MKAGEKGLVGPPVLPPGEVSELGVEREKIKIIPCWLVKLRMINKVKKHYNKLQKRFQQITIQVNIKQYNNHQIKYQIKYQISRITI